MSAKETTFGATAAADGSWPVAPPRGRCRPGPAPVTAVSRPAGQGRAGRTRRSPHHGAALTAGADVVLGREQAHQRLAAEDPTLRVEHNAETHQIVLWCMGEAHTDVAMSTGSGDCERERVAAVSAAADRGAGGAEAPGKGPPDSTSTPEGLVLPSQGLRLVPDRPVLLSSQT